MLTGLEILGVVSAVIQIVDFSCKLVSETQEIYRSASGATKDNLTSEEITKDINALYRDLTRKSATFQRSNPYDIALGDLVDSCAREAKALLHLLGALEMPSDATQWKSFKAAFKSARKQGMVKEIETRLLKLQKQIDSRLQRIMTWVSLLWIGDN